MNEFVTKEDLEIFRVRLLADIEAYLTKPSDVKKWIKAAEVRRILGIAPGTLQSLRASGVLRFSRVGSRGYRYNYHEVIGLLEKNKSLR